jgi:pyruvate,water dikinase
VGQRLDGEVKELDFSQTYAVRSSAVNEDGEQYSFAGQFATRLNVASPAALQEAVRQVQASYNRPTLEAKTGGMAVLIQPMVKAEWSGVLFTREPLTSAPHFVLEGALGAGGVVSGEQTPQRVVLDAKENVVEGKAFLPAEATAQLLAHARRIEALFDGLPQDIEWAWDGAQIWILQARPITNLSPVWTRKIASEVMPGTIRPLTWSINRPMVCSVWGDVFTIVLGERATGLDFLNTATTHQSHAYFNATLLATIFRRMGLPEQGLAFLIRGEKMTRPPLSSTFQNMPGLWRLIQTERGMIKLFAAESQTLFQPKLKDFDEQQLDGLNVAQLWERAVNVQAVLKRAVLYKIIVPIGLSVRRAMFKIPDAWLKDGQPPEVASIKQLAAVAEQAANLLAAQPYSKGSAQERLAQSADGRAILHELEAFIQRYGYLNEINTDVSSPTWLEHPVTVQDLFETFVRFPHETEAKSPGPQSFGEKWKLSRVAPFAKLNSQVAEVYSRIIAHLRWTLVALEQHWLKAGPLKETGDVFFLEIQEVEQLAHGTLAPEKVPALVEARRRAWQADRERVIPSLVYGNTPYVEEERFVLKSGQLKGIAASRGEVEGEVKIAKTLAEANNVSKNTVLVVPYADAGWSAALVQAGAIIAEVGGQLSHGAIIAREYGLPAVMNLEHATQLLQNGQRVRVNGTRGTVEILAGEYA